MMHMKAYLFSLLALLISCQVYAQKLSSLPTKYPSFKSSVVTLKNGRTTRQAHTNVFLKNSSLLYLKGEYTMEADMRNISKVKFDDCEYITIDDQLAYLVDSIGDDRLYCVELFDQEAYERNLRNNVNISNLDLGEMVNVATLDVNGEEDYKLPVFRHYYYLLDGEFVKVHERTILKRLNKQQRTMMKRIVSLPDFSWQNPESLVQLLKAISE